MRRATPETPERGAGVSAVKIGFFSFTEITDPSEHRAYNEWHQLDHMPEQYPLPGLAFGQRWVSTPACRAARATNGALLAATHYMTLYLMTEPVDTTLEEFHALGDQLRSLGRFHLHRRALLSGPFDVRSATAAPRVLVSAEAVPYRPNRGVHVVVEQWPPPGATSGPDPGDSGAELVEVPGVAGVWTFVSDAEHRHVWHPGRHRITVTYLDEDPLTVSASLDDVTRRRAAAGARIVFAGVFETITPWRWDWFDAPVPASS
jgi:hypothetical protein